MPVSFLMPEAYNFIRKETLAQVFSCEFLRNFYETFFHRTSPVATSVEIEITKMPGFVNENLLEKRLLPLDCFRN